MEAPTTKSLSKLPAELRNLIYQLTFTPLDPAKNQGYVDCVSLAPPRDLLSVSRQTYTEGMAHYKAATEIYWANTAVTLEVDRANDMGDIWTAQAFAKSFPAYAWIFVKKVQIIHRNFGWVSTLVKLDDAPGVWRHDVVDPDVDLSALPPQFRRSRSTFVAVECSPKWCPGGEEGEDEVKVHDVRQLEEAKRLVREGKPVPVLRQIDVLLDRVVWG